MKTKKFTTVFLIAFFLSATANTGHALLVDNGDGTIFSDGGTPADVSDDLIFYKNTRRFAYMTYEEQIDAISNLSTGGYNNWRMATRDQVLRLE